MDRPLGAGEFGHTLFRYKQFILDEMTEWKGVLLYFDERQNVNVLLITAHKITKSRIYITFCVSSK